MKAFIFVSIVFSFGFADAGRLSQSRWLSGKGKRPVYRPPVSSSRRRLSKSLPLRVKRVFFEDIKKGRYEEVRMSLEGGMDPNLKEARGLTPLIIAIGKGDVRMVELFLAHGARVDQADAHYGFTPLRWVEMALHKKDVQNKENFETIKTILSKHQTPQ